VLLTLLFVLLTLLFVLLTLLFVLLTLLLCCLILFQMVSREDLENAEQSLQAASNSTIQESISPPAVLSSMPVLTSSNSDDSPSMGTPSRVSSTVRSEVSATNWNQWNDPITSLFKFFSPIQMFFHLFKCFSTGLNVFPLLKMFFRIFKSSSTSMSVIEL